MNNSLDFLEWWNPYVWIVVLGLLIVYLLVIGRFNKNIDTDARVPASQRFYFVTGLLVAGGALGSPLAILGHHYLFSAHMLQQSLLYFVVPPLLWSGTPTWLFRRVFPLSFRRIVLPKITNPLLAVVIFNVLLSFYHFPVIYDWITSESVPFVSMTIHAVLFVSAMLMWFVVTCPEPELNRLNHLKKTGYVVLNGLLLYPACALIIFADVLIYKQSHVSQYWFSFLTPLADQQLGGIIMKIMQEGVFAVALGVLISRWYRKERSEDPEE